LRCAQNYMSQFREYLEKEGVETQGYVDLPLFIRTNADFLQKDLVVPRLPDGYKFIDEEQIVLAPDAAISVFVDMSLKVQVLQAQQTGVSSFQASGGYEQHIPKTVSRLWIGNEPGLICLSTRNGEV